MKDSTISGLYPTQAWAAVGALDFAQESNCPPPFQIVRIRIRKDLLERLGRQFEKDPSKDPSEIAYLKGLEDWTPLARKALFVAARSFIESNYRKESCATGGRANKKAKAIMAETERFLRRARHLKGMEVFKLFPTSEEPRCVSLEDGEYEVYRDGDSLIQKNPRGSEHTVAQANFCNRYVPTARKNLDKETDQGMKSNTN